ncbi:MAG: C25 family cysteine peptidase [candidate division WOR-3 bacterium]|nr:C25 family cysteine peptidase [candidate division WOR-3 bacterium]
MFRMVRIITLLLPGILAAATGDLTQTFEFNPNDFVFDKVNGYDVVALPGQYSTTEPGKPNLPMAVYNVVIPPDAEITGVDVVSISTTALPGEFNIHPSQRPQVLSKPALAFVAPDPKAYASNEAYPAEMVRFTRSGVMGGYRIAGIQLVPLRYFPAQKRLELVTRVAVAVRYERNRHQVLSLDNSQVDLMGQNVRGLVRNSEQVANWSPKTRQTDDWLCDMMVITSTAQAANFQPFVDWKTRRGIKTVVVKTESIYSAYSGRDNQEKIRNCVIDYWQNHGLKWVLIGGDDQIVPVRTCRLTVEGNEENIASDMYYADLQYSWDSNHNDVFGEMEDSVDLLYDVFIGRTPVDGASDVATFFAKDTMFEKHQDTTRLKRVLYGSTMLFDPYHGKVINHIIADAFPSGWTHAHLEDPNDGVYADSMDQGFQLAHVAAHGNPNTFSVLWDYEVAELTNGFTRLNFVNSMACESGWFDGQDCLAEALVNATNGGCIACMLNSRYGFGYPPALGPSELLDLQFYRYFVQGYATQFGSIGMLSKDYFQSLAMDQEVWRWCVFELNLFGDPTLFVWSEKPKSLTVTTPDSVPTGTQVVRVTVKEGTTPVSGALVCLSKGTETYARAWTNPQGWVNLLVSPTTTGSLDLSVSAQNFYPHDGQVPVRGSSNRPALVFAGLRIDDNDGNGRLDPGETANLFVSVKNEGAVDATGTSAVLRTSCPYLTRVDSTSSYGTIAAGATVEGDQFRVTASASTPPGVMAGMVAACTAGQGSWQPYFETRIGDVPPAKKLWADHDNNDMILSVTSLGSIGTLGPYNEGSGLKYPRNAPNGAIYFTSLACGNGPDYVVDRWYGHPTSTSQADWRALDTLHAVIPPISGGQEYEAVIDDGAHSTPKGLTVTQWSASVADPGYRDFVVITYDVANLGTEAMNGLYVGIFSDFDVNNTTDNDVYSDAPRRLTYMTQWGDYQYSAGIKLLSPATAANQSAIDHNVYVRPSGMITEAVKDSFLRGAISRPNSNGTRNWSCVVSAGPFDLPVGGRAFVAFAFVGGNTQQEMLAHADSAQSWFDRSVATTEPGTAAGIAQVGMRVAPSPARGRAQLRFALPQSGRARVEVLDVEGRVVRVLADCELARGTHTLDWDGRDEAGRRVAGGIYVCRLVTPAGTVNRKAVVLR